jgi:hypothetical protein
MEESRPKRSEGTLSGAKRDALYVYCDQQMGRINVYLFEMKRTVGALFVRVQSSKPGYPLHSLDYS